MTIRIVIFGVLLFATGLITVACLVGGWLASRPKRRRGGVR